MCGICGEIRFDGSSADVAAVSRITCAMASRGPDSDGVVAHRSIALGHRRLAIIDLPLGARSRWSTANAAVSHRELCRADYFPGPKSVTFGAVDLGCLPGG